MSELMEGAIKQAIQILQGVLPQENPEHVPSKNKILFCLNADHNNYPNARDIGIELGHVPGNERQRIVQIERQEDELPTLLQAFAYPNPLVLDRFKNPKAVYERFGYLVGKPHLTWNPRLNRAVYICQFGDKNADGRTPGTAIPMPKIMNVNTAYHLGRPHYRIVNGTPNLTQQGKIEVEKGIAGDQVVVRMDVDNWHGMMTDHWLHIRTGNWRPLGQTPWVEVAEGVYYQDDYLERGISSEHPMIAMDPTGPVYESSGSWINNWLLLQTQTLEDCISTPGTFYAPDPSGNSGTRLYVHYHDKANPNEGRVPLMKSFGWYFEPRHEEPNPVWLRFINCQHFGHDHVGKLLMGSRSLYNCDKVTFEGGRYIFAYGSWFVRGACKERRWIPSTVGTPAWNMGDRRDTPDSEFVKIAQQLYGAPANLRDDFRNALELAYCQDGPHLSQTAGGSQIAEGFPEIFDGDGRYSHHIGVDIKGVVRNKADLHPTAIRGQHEGSATFTRGYDHHCSNSSVYYSVADGGSRAPVLGRTNSIRRFGISNAIIEGWNGLFPNAGVVGVSISGDNDAIVMDKPESGGIREGYVRGLVYADIRPKGHKIDNPAQEASGCAIVMNSDIPYVCEDIVVLRSNWAFRGDKAGHVQAISSVQLVDAAGTATDLTESVVPSGPGAELALHPGTLVAFGRLRGKFRRVEMNLVGGEGDAVVKYFIKVKNQLVPLEEDFVDTTNMLRRSGAVEFTKPDDWFSEKVGSRKAWHIYGQVVSGSFTKFPRLNWCRGVRTGYDFRARRVWVLEPEEGVLWTRSNTFWFGSHVIDIDELYIRLKAGEDINTRKLFRIMDDMYTVAEFQQLKKLAKYTDADRDSVFCPKVTVLPPLIP